MRRWGGVGRGWKVTVVLGEEGRCDQEFALEGSKSHKNGLWLS
jgi:hypothetical protein